MNSYREATHQVLMFSQLFAGVHASRNISRNRYRRK